MFRVSWTNPVFLSFLWRHLVLATFTQVLFIYAPQTYPSLVCLACLKSLHLSSLPSVLLQPPRISLFLWLSPLSNIPALHHPTIHLPSFSTRFASHKSFFFFCLFFDCCGPER
ncbi:hypothetical protein V8F06_002250 [Rhypophila decipiens]